MNTTKKQAALLDAVGREKKNSDERSNLHKLRALKRLLISGNKAMTLNDLSEEIHAPKDILLDLLGKLTESGMVISIQKSIVSVTLEPASGSEVRKIPDRGVTVMRYGAVADMHLGSKYARLDALSAIYDIFEAEGVGEVFLLGNMIDGEARFNKHDLLAHGIEGQTAYFVDNYPQRKGVKTRFITGDDHEGWYVQREGIDIGKHLADAAEASGRTDLEYLGHMEHDIELKRSGGSAHLLLLHGGGGSTYAYSYVSQKQLESFQGGEKPTIVLMGHHHKFDYTYPRGSHAVLCGCFQDQTPFLRKKRVEAMIGGCIIEVHQDDRGIVQSFAVRWIPFYDRSFYKGKNWKYHWSRPS